MIGRILLQEIQSNTTIEWWEWKTFMHNK